MKTLYFSLWLSDYWNHDPQEISLEVSCWKQAEALCQFWQFVCLPWGAVGAETRMGQWWLGHTLMGLLSCMHLCPLFRLKRWTLQKRLWLDLCICSSSQCGCFALHFDSLIGLLRVVTEFSLLRLPGLWIWHKQCQYCYFHLPSAGTAGLYH